MQYNESVQFYSREKFCRGSYFWPAALMAMSVAPSQLHTGVVRNWPTCHLGRKPAGPETRKQKSDMSELESYVAIATTASELICILIPSGCAKTGQRYQTQKVAVLPRNRMNGVQMHNVHADYLHKALGHYISKSHAVVCPTSCDKRGTFPQCV